MAKKADLLEEAAKLGLNVTEKNTIAEIETAIAGSGTTVSETAKTTETEVSSEEVKLAKAGKRSSKSLKEAEEKAAKEERKEKGDTAPQSEDAEANVKKGPRPVTRPLIERRGKNYRKVAELVEKGKIYTLTEAVKLVVATNPSKFDASVEMHVRLGVDPRQADQNIRSTVVLPNGTGKDVRVAVLAQEADLAKAKEAGADIASEETVVAQLDKGVIDFDILVTTAEFMPRLSKYARLLGPRGLMPNPKNGTVATDVAKAVKEAKAGKVEYRVDKQSIVHLSIGKVSFGAEKLEQNARAFFDSLQSQKPASVSGSFIKSIATSTTHGPGIKVDVAIG